MTRSVALFLIGLFFGGGAGFLLAASYGITLDGHEHGDPAQHMSGSEHGGVDRHHADPLVLPDDGTAPTLAIDLVSDQAGGWNLHIRTTGFTFAPEHAGGSPVPGEGHAHVYANGEKLGRIYGTWSHLGALPPGKVTVTVTLNTNDHRPIVIDGAPLEASLTIRN
ncbi:MAG: hypothetical protein P1U88_01585 [Thalassobaculaceae bacterium]|nr:hypothetical protein [Thalassobaculaceae bacterium]